MKSPLAITLAQISQDSEFVHLRKFAHVRIDLKYASIDNFMGKNVYGDFNEPFLHYRAAQKFEQAAQRIGSLYPGWALLVFDALRPRSVQRLLWAHVKDTPNEDYVANPDRGSMHNYGCAVDLTVADQNGVPLDMGTPFDTFHPLSQPKLEADHLRSKQLKKEQVENRLILRKIMTDAGFIQLPHEWWHFDAFPSAEVRAQFRIIE